MRFDLRKEDLGFTGRAPVVHVSEARLRAPRTAVFRAFATPATWKDWFPNVRGVTFESSPPYGVGTVRRADVGGTVWVEDMLAWDDPGRFAWTVTSASLPFAAALVESWDFSDDSGGTRLRWTFALEPRLLARLVGPFLGRTLPGVLRRATANLDAYLGRPA